MEIQRREDTEKRRGNVVAEADSRVDLATAKEQVQPPELEDAKTESQRQRVSANAFILDFGPPEPGNGGLLVEVARFMEICYCSSGTQTPRTPS